MCFFVVWKEMKVCMLMRGDYQADSQFQGRTLPSIVHQPHFVFSLNSSFKFSNH